MQRIDALYDVPQYVAARLVRKIAANNFRLPTTERGRVASMPDEVIVRIEQIVLAAYVEAGEDVGGDALREYLSQQALDSRRAMIANGELISKDDFRLRLYVTERRLDKLLADGSIFAFQVDEVEYFPALLVDPTRNQERLQAICRIIAPAPANSRLDFLTAQHGSLGDRRPLDLLASDEAFESLTQSAASWAAEWWRTVVTIYAGEHAVEPAGADPLYTAAAEVDPRRPLWERASQALRAHGYEWPLGPYAELRLFTLFVARQAAGDAPSTKEACVKITVDDDYILIHIVAVPGTVLVPAKVPAGMRKTFIGVAKRVLAYLSK